MTAAVCYTKSNACGEHPIKKQHQYIFEHILAIWALHICIEYNTSQKYIVRYTYIYT